MKGPINPLDIRIDHTRNMGNDTAIRITHIPSGLCVDCDETPSPMLNRKIALYKLAIVLLEEELEKRKKN